ncbi:MAG: aminoacyl-histidine dipeptidase [Defluviitaleaceae bacterium]|nr:aminoacyl-histidine dipeptidase [Defluviitaleaceae bacterium]
MIKNLEPKSVFKHFEAISKIPRGSGDEKAVSDFIVQFAKKLNLPFEQDDWNNLIIAKPASAGYESHAPVILQAHLDMVCEKNSDTQHDFSTDPLDLYVEDDFVKACGTTLGADNGIGVAMCMALLEEKGGKHPPLEIVLTTDEETGMGGAENLNTGLLMGKRLINLDSSDDTTFIMGCAAGVTTEFTIPAQWVNSTTDSTICEITVKGLKGGHSGVDIEKERGNAIRILAHLLDALDKQIGVRLAKISGGMKVNAIPREATATVIFPTTATLSEKAAAALESCKKDLAEYYRASDADMKINWAFSTGQIPYMVTDTTQKVIASLLLIPTGVTAMSREIDGLVNASNNIGVVETNEEAVKISTMPRGMADYFVRAMETQISTLAGLIDANVNFIQRSPSWPYNPHSALLKTAQEVYPNVFEKEAEVTAVHAGLECGLFSSKIRGLDMISFGPNLYDYHTPDEKASISSIGKAWEFLLALLEVL